MVFPTPGGSLDRRTRDGYVLELELGGEPIAAPAPGRILSAHSKHPLNVLGGYRMGRVGPSGPLSRLFEPLSILVEGGPTDTSTAAGLRVILQGISHVDHSEFLTCDLLVRSGMHGGGYGGGVRLCRQEESASKEVKGYTHATGGCLMPEISNCKRTV
jgi:hypothetical protein